MWQSLPEFGTGVLYAILVTAAYTFAVALAAGRGQPRLLKSARYGAYATAARSDPGPRGPRIWDRGVCCSLPKNSKPLEIPAL
jgi:hypothetical protein